jgi:hypothetical protein
MAWIKTSLLSFELIWGIQYSDLKFTALFLRKPPAKRLNILWKLTTRSILPVALT